MTKYTFRKPAIELEKMLICPECTETLSQIDISSFGSCPYCDHTLVTTPELEDYLLKPVVDHWVRTQAPTTPFGMVDLPATEEEIFE